MVNNIFLGIGSNKDDRNQFISLAVKKISEDEKINFVSSSSLYETRPYGTIKQENFLNLVIQVASHYKPEELFTKLKEFEKQLGRTSGQIWGPREIDIDILFYDTVVLNNDYLNIPHKDLVNRDFVLIPMSEIAPDFVHPVLNKTVADLISNKLEKTIIRKINYF